MPTFFDRFLRTTGDRQLTVYLHFPCFDGVVSAALISEVLRARAGFALRSTVPVTYDLRRQWRNTRLEVHSAVVDFLFHPDAEYWADHHSTTFVDEGDRTEFERHSESNRFFYDSESPSCASVIWKECGSSIADQPRYREVVEWADKIDAASYDSVQEAILGDAPALRINRSLTVTPNRAYCEFLVRSIMSGGLAQTACHSEVAKRSDRAQKTILRGLQIAQKVIRLVDEVAILQLHEQSNATVSRYSPYYFFPQARYSVTCLQSAQGTKITAMRNPWLDFESVPLGQILAHFGGGGHNRVGSVIIRNGDSQKVDAVVNSLLDAMHKQDVQTTISQQESAVA